MSDIKIWQSRKSSEGISKIAQNPGQAAFCDGHWWLHLKMTIASDSIPTISNYSVLMVMPGCIKKKKRKWPIMIFRDDLFRIYVHKDCWRRLLRVPWTAKRSNQSILKDINPEYSLEGLILKLKLQYFGHLMQRADSLEKTLMLGKTEGRKRRGQRRIRWLDGITDQADMSLSKLQEITKDREDLHAALDILAEIRLVQTKMHSNIIR